MNAIKAFDPIEMAQDYTHLLKLYKNEHEAFFVEFFKFDIVQIELLWIRGFSSLEEAKKVFNKTKKDYGLSKRRSR